MTRLEELREKYPYSPELDPQPWILNWERAQDWETEGERYYYEPDDDDAPDEYAELGWLWQPRPEYEQRREPYRGLDLNPFHTGVGTPNE
jgi:hypothetical protein